jgi:hypothetical protein
MSVYIAGVALLAAAFAVVGAKAVQAQPACLQPPSASSSSVPGQYCGGDSQFDAPDIRGQPIDLNAACKSAAGPSFVATILPNRTDAFAWVCRAPGQPDAMIDLQQACRQKYGAEAIATLIGIGTDDWRCLRPPDVRAHVVPVLLFPQDKMFDAGEAAFVTASLQRIGVLMSGVRRFYRERTSALVRGTNAFVYLTKTSAADWQNLALCTVHASCPAGGAFDPSGYVARVQQEIGDGRWNVLTGNSSALIGAFVSLGASPPETPTWCGALDLFGQQFFVVAPSNSYAACSPTTDNPPEFENAFYAIAHEFGHAMGMHHSNASQCPDPIYTFNDEHHPSTNLLRPPNLSLSVMCLGLGTSSSFFPFEASHLLTFLLGWH